MRAGRIRKRYSMVTLSGADATPLATTTSVLAPVSMPDGIVTWVVTGAGLATAMEL